jgi:hypothetical protein
MANRMEAMLSNLERPRGSPVDRDPHMTTSLERESW